MRERFGNRKGWKSAHILPYLLALSRHVHLPPEGDGRDGVVERVDDLVVNGPADAEGGLGKRIRESDANYGSAGLRLFLSPTSNWRKSSHCMRPTGAAVAVYCTSTFLAAIFLFFLNFFLMEFGVDDNSGSECCCFQSHVLVVLL